MIYNDVNEVLREFPQRNPVWMPLHSGFFFLAKKKAFPKALGMLDVTDAWNRPFKGAWREIIDSHGVLVGWENVTTVNGDSFWFKVTLEED